MNIIEFKTAVVPMFLPDLEQSMTENNEIYNNEEVTNISLFDVKNLYDIAYDIKETGDADSAYRFKEALSAAVKLDMEYRRQLSHQKKFEPAVYQNYALQIEKHKKQRLDKTKAA